MKKTLQNFSLVLITVLVAVVLNTGVAAAADEVLEEAALWADVAEDIDAAPGYEDAEDSDREWALSLGVSSGFAPDYEGSSDYSFGVGPNISASWRDTIFYKGKTLGANLIREKKFKAGPLVTWSSGRDEDDNDKLEGLGDVDDSIEAGVFASYRIKPFRLRAQARQDLGSGHEGALVELGFGSTMPFDNPLVLVELSTTWASDDYMESFFGIDAKQSLASGLKEYRADAGFKDVKVTMTAGYKFNKRWRIGGAIEYKRLVGDAADSPIVEDKNQFLAGISLSYHMGSKILPEDLQ